MSKERQLPKWAKRSLRNGTNSPKSRKRSILMRPSKIRKGMSTRWAVFSSTVSSSTQTESKTLTLKLRKKRTSWVKLLLNQALKKSNLKLKKLSCLQRRWVPILFSWRRIFLNSRKTKVWVLQKLWDSAPSIGQKWLRSKRKSIKLSATRIKRDSRIRPRCFKRKATSFWKTDPKALTTKMWANSTTKKRKKPLLRSLNLPLLFLKDQKRSNKNEFSYIHFKKN